MMRQVAAAGDFSDAFFDRITCYRERADRFRALAESEPNDRLRESLLALANRYDVIADGLGAKASRFL